MRAGRRFYADIQRSEPEFHMPTCSEGTLHGFAYDSNRDFLHIGECLRTTSDSDHPGL
jgi:hypothetical protein